MSVRPKTPNGLCQYATLRDIVGFLGEARAAANRKQMADSSRCLHNVGYVAIPQCHFLDPFRTFIPVRAEKRRNASMWTSLDREDQQIKLNAELYICLRGGTSSRCR